MRMCSKRIKTRKSKRQEGKKIILLKIITVMSNLEYLKTGEPNLLDGSPPLPPAKPTGQTIQDAYKKSLLDKYLTLEEWVDYEFPPKHFTWEGRARAHLRWEEISEKIDFQDYHDRVEKEFNKTKERIRTFRTGEKKPNRYELGAREFTFTYSPKWFDDSTARLEMSSAIQKLCKYYKDEITQLRAIGEVGSAGLSHIHCFYKLKGGKKITDKNFTRAYKMWNTKKKTGPTGHQGGHHASVRNESDFQGYIDKDIENTWFEVNIDNLENNPVAVNS